ncbi:MAG TPA: hypothetical protein VL981_14890 [Candidatus Methylacidiphilales bacterium]|nr:hypothetical protein [Candidatus Methylacidiphilales bacterium]
MQTIARHLEKRAAFWTLGLSFIVLSLDYFTGPYIFFPIAFVFPVALMAWYRPCRWAILLGAFLCAIREGIAVQWLDETPYDISIVLINTLIYMSVLFIVAILISRVAQQQRALQVKVRMLEGILPVCSFCKKIRDANDSWESLETYIGRRSEAQFSHTVCPDCGRRHYGNFYEPKESKPAVPNPTEKV